MFQISENTSLPHQFFFSFFFNFKQISEHLLKKKNRSKFETKNISESDGEYYFLLHLSRLVLVFLKKVIYIYLYIYMCIIKIRITPHDLQSKHHHRYIFKRKTKNNHYTYSNMITCRAFKHPIISSTNK